MAMSFSQEDDRFLVQYIAENHPDFKGRKGELLYKKLVNQYPDSGHRWQSWRRYYERREEYFDHLIEEYQLEHSISISQTAKSPKLRKYGFSEAEDALLVEYIAKNDVNGRRKGSRLYDRLSQYDGKEYQRSSKSWCHRYSRNAEYFDKLVDIYRRNHNVNSHFLSTPKTSFTTLSASTGSSLGPSVPLISAPQSVRFKHEEDMCLVAYLAKNTSSSPRLGLDERKRFKLYSEFTSTSTLPWATCRSANFWFNRYTSNIPFFETLIEQYRSENRTPTKASGFSLGKRKRDYRAPTSTSASTIPISKDAKEEDGRKAIVLRTRKSLGAGVSSSRVLNGGPTDEAGMDFDQSEGSSEGNRRKRRLRATTSSRRPRYGSDNQDELDDDSEKPSTPEENRRRESAYPLSTATMRVTRQRSRHLRIQAEKNDQDEDDDLMEIETYLRELSVDSTDLNTQAVPNSNPPIARLTKTLNSYITSGSKVRFASPPVSANYSSTATAALVPSLTDQQRSAGTPPSVWRRVSLPPRRQSLLSDTGVDTPHDSDDMESENADMNDGAASVTSSPSTRRTRLNSSVIQTRNDSKSSTKAPSHSATERRTSARLRAPSKSGDNAWTRNVNGHVMGLRRDY